MSDAIKKIASHSLPATPTDTESSAITLASQRLSLRTRRRTRR